MAKYVKAKIDRVFEKEINEIAVKNTLVSKYMPSPRRITKAIRRHSMWPKIKEDIINTPLEDDRWKNEHE